MARARNIQTAFFDNEHLGKLSDAARILFVALFQLADCEGRLEDRPERIKGYAFRYRDGVDCEALLEELAKDVPRQDPFIIRYEVDGLRLIWLPGFKRNQRLTAKERQSGSQLPAYVENKAQPRCAPDAPQEDSGSAPVALKSEIGNLKTERPVSRKRSLLSQKFMVPIGDGLDAPPWKEPFQAAWDRWLDYLSAKDPYTVLDTLNAQMAFLSRAGPQAAISAIDRSIAAGSKKLWLEEPRSKQPAPLDIGAIKF